MFNSEPHDPPVQVQIDAQKIFTRAADLISERGLSRGSYFDDKGRVCLAGALAEAVGYDVFYGVPDDVHFREWSEAIMLCAYYLGDVSYVHGALNPWGVLDVVAMFSDCSDRDRVVEMLRLAADRYGAEVCLG